MLVLFWGTQVHRYVWHCGLCLRFPGLFGSFWIWVFRYWIL